MKKQFKSDKSQDNGRGSRWVKIGRANVRKWTSITPQFHVVLARYNFWGLALQEIKMRASSYNSNKSTN
jgi:hypothetical protein